MASLRRLNLRIPDPIYERVTALADAKGMSTTEAMRWVLRVGLNVAEAEQAPGKGLAYMEDGEYKPIHLL